MAINIPEHFPKLHPTDQLTVTTSSIPAISNPVARACFQLERVADVGNEMDKRPRWGEKMYVKMILPELSRPVFYIHSRCTWHQKLAVHPRLQRQIQNKLHFLLLKDHRMLIGIINLC